MFRRQVPLSSPIVAAMTRRKAPGRCFSPWKKPAEAPGPSPGYYFSRKIDVPFMSARSAIYSPADPTSGGVIREFGYDGLDEQAGASSLEYANLREFEEPLRDPADSRARGLSGL